MARSGYGTSPLTGRLLGATMTDGADSTMPKVSAVNSVAFSPDGKILASASNDGTARLWDVATSREIGAPLVHGAAAMMAVAFSSDGTLVATAGRDGAIQLWDVRTHQRSGSSFTSGGGAVMSAAFAPNGQILASGTVDGRTELWDVATHRQIGVSLAADTGSTKRIPLLRSARTGRSSPLQVLTAMPDCGI